MVLIISILLLFIVLFLPICGMVALVIFGGVYKRKKPGLIFHVIQPKSQKRLSYFPHKKFSDLLDHLAVNGYSGIAPGSVATTAVPVISASNRSIIFVFDDGLESFLTEAVPLLDKHNFKAAVFPVTAYIGSTSTWDVFPALRALSREQIAHIAMLGHEIGSHTHTHPNLTFLNSRDCADELCRSKEILEEIICKQVITLSLPFGCYNERVWDLACKAGYKIGITYQNVPKPLSGLLSLSGVYAFDTVGSIMQKITNMPSFSFARAQSRLLPHFAKGTPMWKFRSNYSFFR
jgi:peptidoglycan/xylan/chitin deacetylase (PgdA/CDA1 family)